MPTCPVELTASALAQVVAKGDLWYEVNAKSFTDTDELPPKIVAAGPNAEFRRAEADGHRHDNDRERDSWEVLDTGADAGIMPGKTWSSTYVNIIEADAGLMIPQAMWPTTDRVTALVDCDVSSELDLSGESDTGHSKSSSCCADGGAACLCEPSFQLVVGPGNVAKLTVDGNTIMLSNSDPVVNPADHLLGLTGSLELVFRECLVVGQASVVHVAQERHVVDIAVVVGLRF